MRGADRKIRHGTVRADLGWRTLQGPGSPGLPLALSIEVYQAPLFKTAPVCYGPRYGLLRTLRKFVIVLELKSSATRGTAYSYANLCDRKNPHIVGSIHSHTLTVCSHQINASPHWIFPLRIDSQDRASSPLSHDRTKQNFQDQKQICNIRHEEQKSRAITTLRSIEEELSYRIIISS